MIRNKVASNHCKIHLATTVMIPRVQRMLLNISAWFRRRAPQKRCRSCILHAQLYEDIQRRMVNEENFESLGDGRHFDYRTRQIHDRIF